MTTQDHINQAREVVSKLHKDLGEKIHFDKNALRECQEAWGFKSNDCYVVMDYEVVTLYSGKSNTSIEMRLAQSSKGIWKQSAFCSLSDKGYSYPITLLSLQAYNSREEAERAARADIVQYLKKQEGQDALINASQPRTIQLELI